MIVEICVTLSVILLTFYYFKIWMKTWEKKSEIPRIPGPKPRNNKQGNLEDITSAGSLHKFLEQNHQQYGPIISYWIGSKMAVSIASSKLFKEHSAYFDRPVELFEFIMPLMGGDALQVTNGDDGHRRHAAYSKSYNQSSIKKFYGIFNKLAKELTEKWSRHPKGEHILVQEDVFHFAIRSILESTCGEEFENEKLVLEIKAIYDHCWTETERFMVGDILEPGTDRESQFYAKKQTLYKIIRDVFSKRREMNFSEEEEKLPIDTIIGLNLPEMNALQDLLTLVIAGFHTSALLMTWCIYFLATHEEIQIKAREEVMEVLGNSDELTADMVSKMKYLQQVLKETLRVAIIGPVAARVSHSDIIIEGFTIPAETTVIHALGVSLHDQEIYPEPLKFDPDRFSSDNEQLLPDFSFEPFGFGGKRKCPGYNFSYAEATVFLGFLLRSLKVQLAFHQSGEPEYGFVTKIKDDLWITATPV